MSLKRKGARAPAHLATAASGDMMSAHQIDDPHPAVTLVGYGFRCWMLGHENQDLTSWDLCWNRYAWTLGPDVAKRAVKNLSSWVRDLRSVSARSMTVLPTECCGFCKDECLAISMIAAGQNDACPAMRACAFALLESTNLDAPVESGMEFAATLQGAGVHLDTNTIINATALIDQSTTRH